MYDSQGILNIDSNSNCTIAMSSSVNDTIMRVNNIGLTASSTFQILAGKHYQITFQWAVWTPLESYTLSWFFIGLAGIILMIVGTTYGAYKIKEGDYGEGVAWAVVCFTIGLCLIIAWVAS